MKKVIAIFDIGKTNKKLFLFDENYQEVYQSYIRIPEIKDEGGFPCDDLAAIEKWIKQRFKKIINDPKYKVTGLNFSTYGASFVHLDKNGKRLTPLYNYLKPLPQKTLKQFYKKYGSEKEFSKKTASPSLGMLNSGLQLYWLKYTQPKIFKKISWSIHFPQYLSYLFTGILLSEFTSIGCHTGLWDFDRQDYHQWVYSEGIDKKLPPIVRASEYKERVFFDKKIKVGIGIHDSSSALIPYLKADKNPFLLISTGTWSISMNPFNNDSLKGKDLRNDCLNFLSWRGKSIKVARLFLGNEYKLQIKKLNAYFRKKKSFHRSINMDEKLITILQKQKKARFHFESIGLKREQPDATDFSFFPNYKTAYHQLMVELIALQVDAIQRAIGKTKIDKIYIDGGFANNEIYVKLLAKHFYNKKIRTTQSPLGSSLGAAMMIGEKEIGKRFLKKNYLLRKIK